MANENDLLLRQKRGEDAAHLLKEGLLKETLDELRNEAFETFSRAAPTDSEGLLNCRLMLSAINQLEEKLNRLVTKGQAASKELTALRQQETKKDG